MTCCKHKPFIYSLYIHCSLIMLFSQRTGFCLDNSQIGTLIKTILNRATIKLYKILILAKYMCYLTIFNTFP